MNESTVIKLGQIRLYCLISSFIQIGIWLQKTEIETYHSTYCALFPERFLRNKWGIAVLVISNLM